MPSIKNPLVPGDATRPRPEPLQCRRCRSADDLVLDAIESLEPHAGELMVKVSYTCRACEASYAHNAAFHDVAAVLNRTGSETGLLQFGGVYFHCGEPMTFAHSSGRSVRAPLATEESDDGLPGVYLKTRVIQCRCGFRMELPA